MKQILTVTAAIAMVILLAGGCYYDKKDLVYPTSTGTCDTTHTTYSGTVVPILTANCYNCHAGAASAGAGIALDKYSSLLPYINNGQLVRDVMQVTGANAMPKGGAKLDNCSIDKIIAWINTGRPNN